MILHNIVYKTEFICPVMARTRGRHEPYLGILGTAGYRVPRKFRFMPTPGPSETNLSDTAENVKSGREYFRLGAESYSSLGRVRKKSRK